MRKITATDWGTFVDETVAKRDRERLTAVCRGTEPDAVMTRKEVAALFGVKPSAVDRWRRAGTLKAVFSPGGERVIGFDRADVLKKRAAR